MAIEETVTDIVLEVGRIGKWLQALGLLVIIWIIFQVVNFMINRKKQNELKKIRNDLFRIEDKLDKLIWKKKMKRK